MYNKEESWPSFCGDIIVSHLVEKLNLHFVDARRCVIKGCIYILYVCSSLLDIAENRAPKQKLSNNDGQL